MSNFRTALEVVRTVALLGILALIAAMLDPCDQPGEPSPLPTLGR